MPTLTVIIASTRPGRAGTPVARWVVDRAEAHGGFDVRVADLAEINLPLLDEPNHPRLRRYEHEHTRAWSALVDASDAFVIVTPEYNHGYPAPLKNALDYLHAEWAHKAVGLVSYGAVAGGVRSVQALKPVLQYLKMIPAGEGVIIPFVARHIVDGALQPTPALEQSATAMLDELRRLEATLRPLR
ncbi:NADPH-dependent FMN reductase [Catenuloplanes atrovinosus]|uniref:NAD(P)H-dependent FMN reductase n=1 Tax=Catenuloplanes atrovinosus TaxID=137266 RepID=A0AAE3YGB2_9ACTN|nr:NAD(P)H-dependent oxidoreductase [Catenuloplanes atrovinosus]MDR7273473.1 NAD(P)H-dependent FMN reductase [Catenuloplanes atrovinosus]